MKVLKIFLILFSIKIISVQSMRCFNCSLVEQHRCAAAQKNIPKHECPEPDMHEDLKKRYNIYPVCIKITKKSKNAKNPGLYTDRRCGLFNGYRDDCDDLLESGWENCYSCKGPLCNGGMMESQPILSVVLIFGIIMLIYIWNFDTTPFL